MKRTITGIALVLALVFTATAWSQEPPMEPGKMGKGKMGMGKMETEEMEMGESSQMKACMQMMGEIEAEGNGEDRSCKNGSVRDGPSKRFLVKRKSCLGIGRPDCDKAQGR